MSGWLVGASVLASGLGLAAMLWLARRVADRLGSDDPAGWRSVLWAIVALGLLAALYFVPGTLPSLGIVVLVTVWVLVGTALEQRGGVLRGRLAVLQLYAVFFCSAYLYANGAGLLVGTRASAVASFALHEQLTQVSLPLADRVLGFSRAADPAVASYAVSAGLSRHLLLWLAVAAFVFAVYAAAYLARRPLPLPGAGLLPSPRIFALVFAALSMASALTPSAHPVGHFIHLPALVLCPLFVADGGALLHRWLLPLRARGLVLALSVAAFLVLPALAFVVAALGVISQLAGLRELLPFAAIDEAPLKRPGLAVMLAPVGLSSLCVVAGASAAAFGLGSVSPLLGASAEVCGNAEASVDWELRTATFPLASGRFTMDLDETPLDLSAPTRTCELAGKRLCTSDEWYLACACTYPLEVEAGTKTSTLYALVARADRERAAGEPGPRQPTMAADKRSELRGLLTGRTELVSQARRRGLLLAGPSDAQRDAWTVDCRHRSFSTERAVGAAPAAARCCR